MDVPDIPGFPETVKLETVSLTQIRYPRLKLWVCGAGDSITIQVIFVSMINTDYRNDSTRHKGEAETATAIVGRWDPK